MNELWREPGPWNDSLRHRRSWATGRPSLQTPASFDRPSWLLVEQLVAGATARDRDAVSQAMKAALGLPRGRRAGLKHALGVALWCNVAASIGDPVSDESLEELAWRVYPAADTLLNVTADTLTLVLGDSVRMTYDDEATYSVKDGEFVLVAAVLLAELMRQTPPPANDLEALYDQCRSAFDAQDADAVREAWLATLRPWA